MRRRTLLIGLVAGAISALGAGESAAQTVSIDLSAELQIIEGFGGFGPKKVWWDPAPWHDQEYLDRIVDDLGTTILRTQLYWDGEVSNDNDDSETFNWDGFDFGPESDNGKQFDSIQDLAAKAASSSSRASGRRPSG